jgi:hypothetical protein
MRFDLNDWNLCRYSPQSSSFWWHYAPKRSKMLEPKKKKYVKVADNQHHTAPPRGGCRGTRTSHAACILFPLLSSILSPSSCFRATQEPREMRNERRDTRVITPQRPNPGGGGKRGKEYSRGNVQNRTFFHPLLDATLTHKARNPYFS